MANNPPFPVRETIIVQQLKNGVRVDIVHDAGHGTPPKRLSTNHLPDDKTAQEFAARMSFISRAPFEQRGAQC